MTINYLFMIKFINVTERLHHLFILRVPEMLVQVEITTGNITGVDNDSITGADAHSTPGRVKF